MTLRISSLAFGKNSLDGPGFVRGLSLRLGAPLGAPLLLPPPDKGAGDGASGCRTAGLTLNLHREAFLLPFPHLTLYFKKHVLSLPFFKQTKNTELTAFY